MIISAITIENFKSIKDPVRIELKPITLLYGANSVGKSTIIQALHYAREIIRNPWVDVDRTETGGDTLKLGGFQNLVYNHDLEKSIRLKFELNLPEFLNYDLFEDTANIIEDQLKEYPEAINCVKKYYEEQVKKENFPWVELVVQQNSSDELPYVSSTAIGFGEDEFIFLSADSGNNMEIELDINPNHPLYSIATIDVEKIDSLFFTNVTSPSYNADGKESAYVAFSQGRLPRVNINFHDNGKSVKENNDEHQREIVNKFESLLNAVWLAHTNALEEDLADFRYVGPLRAVPDANFKPLTRNDPSRWANGLAAWDSLSEGSWDIEIVNEWLSDKFFKTGYEVIRELSKEINVESELYKGLIAQSQSQEKIIELLNNVPTRTRISIKQINSDISLQPTDIGVGISQVLPIIPLSLGGGWDHEGIIAIEQPELHIHPAMQVVLGDLFIEGLDYEVNMPGRKRFILETHSEHLLLRLLRRIREPRDGSCVEIKHEDLGIYVLESSQDGVSAIRIRVNEEGEFKDPWPKGFFNERAEELF
jgi:hypothetical protein